MSGEQTQNLSDDRAFKQLVVTRLDSIDAGMRDLRADVRADIAGLDSRLQRLETESERRAVETKPIWERALAEIAELRNEMREGFAKLERRIEKGLDILNRDIFKVRRDQEELEGRVESLESKSA